MWHVFKSMFGSLSLSSNRDNSHNFKHKLQITGNKDCTIILSVEQLNKKMIDSTFYEFPEKVKEGIRANQNSFEKQVEDRMPHIKKEGDELDSIICSPDFQYTAKKCTLAASRSCSQELHRMLSYLLIERINNDDMDLPRIVYNEAVLTISKLTKTQFKLLALCLHLKYATQNDLYNLMEFKKYLESIFPFTTSLGKRADYDHMEYTGCVSEAISHSNVGLILKDRYSRVFSKFSPQEIEAYIASLGSAGKTLLSSWRNLRLSKLKLTSVGVMIGCIYSEIITGESIDAKQYFLGD